ncbi:MAG: hypothetical protein GWP04_08280 [Gammaproteobacteria bacterium]|nr:hypothetical protein [Gammaproteobacteria bacterium]
MTEIPPQQADPQRRHRRGRFVVLVGPDGVGKTTVARHLLRLAEGSTAYFHFRPLILTPMAAGPPEAMEAARDKGSVRGSMVLGWVRIIRNLLRFWVGYVFRVRPALARGTLVVGDRWAYGYLVQPAALKFYGPPWVARWILALFPRPDLVANLAAPAEVIHVRKTELSLEQIEGELEGWAQLPVVKLRTIDAGQTPDQAATAIMKALEA